MIPKVELEHLKISRLVCGTNPFNGVSHYTFLRDLKYNLRFRNVDKIAEIMLYLLQEHGVNACLSSPRDRIYNAIQMVQKESGEKYHWFCSPSQRRTVKGLAADIMIQIQWCADHGVSVCMPHRSYTDKAMDLDRRVVEGLEPILTRIRDLKMIPGLSAHSGQIIPIVELQEYDVPVVIQPLNLLGYQSNIAHNTLADIIAKTKIQVIDIKPLAAGRIPPDEGLEYCFSKIKPIDFVACGFDLLERAKEDANIIEKLLAA